MDFANQPGSQFLPDVEQTQMPTVQPVGPEQLRKFTQVFLDYKAGKARTEHRIIGAENWWKLRNRIEEEKNAARWPGFRSQSAWLHNVINSKHADAMDNYPQPVVLPRERGDEQEAKSLSSILPCVFEQNHFNDTYSDVMWQKLKFGTGLYRVTWDKNKLNGLGDISIEKANLLNVFWEPGVTDIQESQYFIDTELVDVEVLEQQYPAVKGKIKTQGETTSKFQYDDNVSTSGKATVFGVYYHKNGKLHYCKFTGDNVLESTENAGMVDGLYDHGRYPFVFDPLYPIEGSPCGYGYVDVCQNPQTEIDLLRTAIVQNAMAGATPRQFVRADGSINEEEYLDVTRPLVHVNGNLGEDSIRPIPNNGLNGNYISFLQETINELRETSGNTESSTGATPSGVTAASAIAALQEAAGKTSRDATRGSHRAYQKIVEICIELIRQFYDVPRQFRIVGETGRMEFQQYDNAGIVPQPQGSDFGIDMGYRVPAFDIKIEAEKKNAYSTMSQNELAIQFYQLGFFNPQATDQALACIEMMEFQGKEDVSERIRQNGTLQQQLQQMVQYAASIAAQYGDTNALQQIANMQGVLMGQMPQNPAQAKEPMQRKAGTGNDKENAVARNARERSAESTEVR